MKTDTCSMVPTSILHLLSWQNFGTVKNSSLFTPSQPVRGKRWWWPISNTWSHTVHSHDHPITGCNPNHSPIQRFYISPQMHWGVNLKDQENRKWGHYVPAYLQADRPNDQPTNQPAYLQTILPATCRLSMPTGTPHLLWKWKVNYHFQKVCNSTPMHVFFDAVHSVHCRQPLHKAQPTKHTMFFNRYLCHTVTMSIPTWFNPHGMMIIREQVTSSIVHN